MEKVSKLDIRAAFKALDDIEIPAAEEKMTEAERQKLDECFRPTNKTDSLLEDYYNVSSKEDLGEAADERAEDIAQAKLARIEKIVDLDAESPEDIQPSYVGKTIIQCPQCMTMFYKDEKDIVPSEDDPKVVNVNEPCQHCGNISGYEVIGKVAAVEENEMDKFEEQPVEETEDELNLDFEAPEAEEGEEAGEEELNLEPVEETEEEVKESLNEGFFSDGGLFDKIFDKPMSNYVAKLPEDKALTLIQSVLDKRGITDMSARSFYERLQAGETILGILRLKTESLKEGSVNNLDGEDSYLDIDNDLTSYYITDGTDTAKKDGVLAKQALREILDFIKSHLANRKDITLSWNEGADGKGDTIVSINSKDERSNRMGRRTSSNWPKAEKMIRNALHLHNDKYEDLNEDLTKDLKDYNDFINFLQATLKQDEEALEKAKKMKDNADVIAAIERRIANDKADLEQYLPKTVKDKATADELPTAEEAGLEEPSQNKEEVKAESLTEGRIEDRPLRDDTRPELYGEDVTDKVVNLLATDFDVNSNVPISTKRHGADREWESAIDLLNVMKDGEAIIGCIKPEADRYYADRYNSKLIDNALAGIKSQGWTKDQKDAFKAEYDEDPEDVVLEAKEEEKFPNPDKHELVDTVDGVEIYHCNKCGKYSAMINGKKVKKDSIEEIKDCIAGKCDEAICARCGKDVKEPCEYDNQYNHCENRKDIEEAQCKLYKAINHSDDEVKELHEGSDVEAELNKFMASLEEGCNKELHEDDNELVVTDAAIDAMLNSPEFQKSISEEEVEGYLEEGCHKGMKKLEELEDIKDDAVVECITKSLTNVYENVESFALTDCELINHKFIVEGVINFKSGLTRDTKYIFTEAVYEGNKATLKGINESLAKDGEFTLTCFLEDNCKLMIAENLGYKYTIGGNLVEGLAK